MFDEDNDYEVVVAHDVEEEKNNAVEAGAVVEEDRAVNEGEEIAPVVREGEGREEQEEDNAAGEEERVDDAYASDGNADVIVEEDRLLDEAEQVAIAVADYDLVVREIGEQWAEENDDEGMERREEIDVVSEEERVDNTSVDDEAASDDFFEVDEIEEVVVAVDPVVREAEGQVDAEQSAEENDEGGVEGKEEDNIAGEEYEEVAAAALAVRAEESSEEEDTAVQHVRTICVLMIT